MTNDQEIHLHSVKLHLAIENCERYVISISVHANLQDCILLRICLRSKSVHALISLVIFIGYFHWLGLGLKVCTFPQYLILDENVPLHFNAPLTLLSL